ncbi:TetR family transcriptional regulator [Acidisphaera sp. L21]|uniref:TetR family transcriptional regulator n=1 Tax=Acidisphaera sp. L21 TaxID=1641851 RepID=UPI00131A785B|nr:TetR family transcriptional regulator [Acidisphaera sp. L21]
MNMNDTEFDTALVAAAFAQAAETGWSGLSIVESARRADLPLDRARMRFPGPAAVLYRFGVMADAAALAEPTTEATPRERMFDLLMRRFDVLQQHREGMVALMRVLPTQPLLAMTLGAATLRSMAWMLEAAGLPAGGLRGLVRAKTLVGVWLYALRAWKNDESADLAGTMAALDKALDQAERVFDLVASKTKMEVDDPLEGVVDLPPDPDEVADRMVQSNPPPPPAAEPPGSPA